MNFLISFGTYYQYLKKSILDYIPSDVECHVAIEKFSDGEISVKFEQSLRGQHLFIFGEITNNLSELLLTIDAAKRSSVKEITVILPYYGYSRQDKREGTRGCIGASVFSHVLQSMGINRVISIDLHAEQIQGYFQIPFDHIRGKHIFIEWLRKQDLSNAVIATPDTGGTVRAGKFASELNLPLVTINKRRDRPGHIASMELTGDVKGKDVYFIDDIVDSGGTVIKSDKYVKELGAKSVHHLITHPVLSGDASIRISREKINLITSDTLKCFVNSHMQVISCGAILADTIERIANEESISTLSV